MARNGDGLSKRRGIWSFRYRDEAGVWREKSTGETSYAKAREIRREFLDRARDGQLPTAAAELTIEQALANRCEFVEATGAKSSVAPTRTATKHLVRVLGPKRKLSSITNADIRRYQVIRSKEETRGEKTSPKTINNEVLHLVAVLKEAKLWKMLHEDYRPLKVPKRGPGKALTPEDGERLFHIAAQRDGWTVAFLCGLLSYATGCRSHEIKSLQLCDIDLEREEIHIQRHKTKSDAGARDVALGPIGLAAVRQLLERARALGASEPEHYLLPHNLSRHTKKDDPLCGQRGFDPSRHQSTWESAWTSLKSAAGMPNFRFHDFRHTYITQGVENGVPVEVMQAQVGHISPEMVRHYTHLSSRAKVLAASKIADQNMGVYSLLQAATTS